MPAIEKRGKYYYKKVSGKLKRVPAPAKTGGKSRKKRRSYKKDINRPSKSFERSKSDKPNVGDRVKIIKKPYVDDYVEGTVKRVLTRSAYHSRGHKVMLESGDVGRMVAFI